MPRHTLSGHYKLAHRTFANNITDKLSNLLSDSVLVSRSKWVPEGVAGDVILLRGPDPCSLGAFTITVGPKIVSWTLTRLDGNHIHGSMDSVMKDDGEIATRIAGDCRTFLPFPHDLLD